MTIAISVKVNDGVVLAADSASSMLAQDPITGNIGVTNVYNNGNKVYNLHKRLPIGAITWGVGSIGQASIATLAKDFRQLISINSDSEWKVDPDDYSVEDIANKFCKFMYTNYMPAFNLPGQKPDLGFVVAGYSSSAKMAEEWIIEINNGVCNGPVLSRREIESGASWHGQPEAISRLIMGFDNRLQIILKALGLEEQQVTDIMTTCQSSLQAPFVIPPMPIQDAIDLAEFLVDTTIKFTRFSAGAPTVGGPIEIAAITKHEGFKWVKRKHYFSAEYNRD